MTCVGGANWDASRDVIKALVEAIGCVEGFIAADGGQDCSAADVLLIVADQGLDGLSSSCTACFLTHGGEISPACYTCAPPADGCACTMADFGLFSSEDKSGISDGCWRCALGAPSTACRSAKSRAQSARS